MPINSTFGEKDWGWCLEPGSHNIQYTVSVKTDIYAGKGGGNGAVQIKLIGDYVTNWLILSESGFQTSKADLGINLPVVGDIKMIAIKNLSNTTWMCQNILFIKVIFMQNFNCKGNIEPDATEQLPVQGFKRYKIKILKESYMACNDALSVRLNGLKGSTSPINIAGHGIVTQEFSQEFMTSDVGTIASVVLVKKKNGITCNLKYVELHQFDETSAKDEIKSFDISNSILVDSLSMKVQILSSDLPLRFSKIDQIPLTDQSFGLPLEETPEYENLKVVDIEPLKADALFNGQGCLSPVDSKNMADLKCDTTLQEILFLFKIYNITSEKANLFPNTEFVVGKCPSNCGYLGSKTIGLDIHPLVSSICISAVADRVISVNGGIVGISIMPGLKTQDKGVGSVYSGIKIASGGEYPLSQYLSKVDNPDMVVLNARIMNAQGQPDSFGRAELRIDETFHAICADNANMDILSAMVCREAGQAYGQQYFPGASFTDPTDTNCALQCGSPFVNRLGISCPATAVALQDCDRLFIENCNGSKDLVVMCSDTELTDGEPNFKRAFEPAGLNRYQPAFWYNDYKTYPCEGSLGEIEAQFMCMAAGYEKGGFLSSATKDDNIMNPDGGSKSAVKVKCPFDASGFGKDCRVQQSGKQCLDQAVIHCREPKGFSPAFKAALVPPGRLPLPPLRQAACGDSAMDLTGDPGSTYVIECPANCQKEGEIIEGTGVYSSDTSLCVAAIHSGAMFASESSVVQITLGYPQFKLPSTIGHNIVSLPGDKKYKTFKVSKVTSCSLYMTKLFEKFNQESSFFQLNTKLKYDVKFKEVSKIDIENSFNKKIKNSDKINLKALKSSSQNKFKIKNAKNSMLKITKNTSNKNFSLLSIKSKSKIKSKLKINSTINSKHNLDTAKFNDMPQQDLLKVKKIKKSESQKQFDGTACISKTQQKDIIPVRCDWSLMTLRSQLGIVDIEYERANVWPNYGSVLIQCPPKCGGMGTYTYGINIHPWNASMCISAVIDRSISLQGGIARVTLVPGLSFYENGSGQILNVKVKRHEESRLSQITSSVDNPDMAQMNIRLMDSSNNPNSQGRAEMKWFDSWHALCGLGDNLKTANLLCMQAGQLSGFQMQPMRTPDDATNTGCGEYCGADSINRVQLICPDTANTFMECEVVNFVVCDSFNDLVVKCLDEELGPNEPDMKRAFIKVGDRRYIPQFFQGNKKTLPCLNSIKEQEAVQMCRAEGQKSGGTKSILKLSETHPIADEMKNFFAAGVSCPSSERVFSNKCGMAKTPKDTTCDDLQQVIECIGEQDPTEDYFAPQVPVMRMPLPPAVNASCDTSAMELPGDPGSKQVVRCPSNCQESGAKLEGSGVYSLDSSICRSAIHSGVAYPGKERVINVTLGQPMKELTGTQHQKIQSYGSESIYKTFKVSETDSCSLFMTELFDVHMREASSQRFKSNFIQISSRVRMMSKTRMKEEESDLVKQWLMANFQTPERQFKPAFHQIRMGDEIVNLDGTNQLSMAEDPNAVVFKKNLPFEFTIAFGMKLPFCPFEKDMTIATNGNSGFLIGIRKAVGLEKCRIYFQNYITDADNQKFDTEFRPYQSYEFTNYVFVYAHGDMQFQVNGKEQVQKNNLRFNEFGNGEDLLHIGADSTSKLDRLFGAINQFLQFEEAINTDLVIKLTHDGVTEQPQQNTSNGEYTVDGRSCITSCKNGAPGQDTNKIDANEGLDMFESMFKKKKRKNIGDILTAKEDEKIDAENEAIAKAKADADEELQRQAGICKITFAMLLSVYPFKVGQNAYIDCPRDCLKHANVVFGPSDTSTDKPIQAKESSVCIAAIHNSAISDENGGGIEVIHAGEHRDYNAINKNNVMSKSINRSIGFQVKNTRKPVKCTQYTTFQEIQDNVSSDINVMCPKSIYKLYQEELESKGEEFKKLKKQFIQGSQLQNGRGQSKQSRICQSALHSGILGNNQDTFMTLRVHKLNYTVSYTCSEDKDCDANGISSGAVVSNVGQTIDSTNNSCGYTKVTIYPNYDISKDFIIVNKGERGIQQIDSILNEEQKGLRALKVPNTSSLQSQFLFRRFGCSTQMYIVSFRTMNENFNGSLILILNQNEINFVSNQQQLDIRKNKIKFILKNNDSKTILFTQKLLEPIIKYKKQTVKITVMQGTIKAQLQPAGSLSTIELFEIKDDTIIRGSVGFGFLKTTDLFIQLAEVAPVNDRVVKKIPYNNFCSRPRLQNIRTRFCRTQRCDLDNNLQYFCKMCCNKMVYVNDKQTCIQECMENNKT